jgi:hypothetical protein
LLNGESRCDELGSNCLGVFSGQAVDYVSTGEWGGWELAENPRVQTSKFLQHANVAGQARPAFYIQDGTGWSVATNVGGTGLRGVRDANGVLTIPIDYATQYSSLTGVLSARYYVFFSADYESTDIGGSPACTNDKHIQLGDYFTAYTSDGGSGFTSSNAGAFASGVGPEDLRGKLARIEMVMEDYDNESAGVQMHFYVKNVTDDTAEEHFQVDQRLAEEEPNKAGFTEIVHRYQAGSCAGTADIMFAMGAHWAAAYSGQRIGSAYEVEGVSGETG